MRRFSPTTLWTRYFRRAKTTLNEIACWTHVSNASLCLQHHISPSANNSTEIPRNPFRTCTDIFNFVEKRVARPATSKPLLLFISSNDCKTSPTYYELKKNYHVAKFLSNRESIMKLKRDALKIRKPSGLKRIETAVYRNFILPRSRYSKSLLGLQKLFRRWNMRL